MFNNEAFFKKKKSGRLCYDESRVFLNPCGITGFIVLNFAGKQIWIGSILLAYPVIN